MHELFISNPLLTLFIVTLVGAFIGKIRVKGFQFGIAAVLFVGMLFGSFVKGISLPEFVYIFGLVLFVYCTGIEAGPSFFTSFTKQKIYINIVIVMLYVISALSIVVLSNFSHISKYFSAGVFAGAHTNTPALAAVLEQIKKISEVFSNPDLATAPVVGYGIAYPLGVFIVIMLFSLLPRFIRSNQEMMQPDKEQLMVKDLIVTNPGVCNMAYKNILTYHIKGYTISRGIIKNKLTIVTPETKFHLGDIIVVVGNKQGIYEAKALFGGKESSVHLEEEKNKLVAEKIFLSRKKWVGKPYHELSFFEDSTLTITRIMRGGIEIVVQPDTIFELGDQLTVVGPASAVATARKELGDEMKSLAEIDIFSLSLGIILGIFVGMIPIPLPIGGSFHLGNAGGPLLVGLLLGFLGRTQKISWRQPQHVTYMLKEMGIILFLAGIGISTGAKFGATIMTPLGLQLLLFGALLTLVVTVIMSIACLKWFKIPWPGVMGIIAGMQTQPACLAYANQQTKSNAVNIWYASVYPLATATKILIAQLIIQL